MSKDKRTIHKRVQLDITCDILVQTLATLSGTSYKHALEAAVLYGVAYLNMKNKMEMTNWIGEIQLPTLKDVEELS